MKKMKMEKKNKRIVTSPNEDVAKDAVLAQQEAQSKIKQIITDGVLNDKPKEMVEDAIKLVLKNYRKNSYLDKEEMNRVYNGLKIFAQNQFFLLWKNVETIRKKTLNKAISMGIEIGDLTTNADGEEVQNVKSDTKDQFRSFVTTLDKGQPIIEDYQKKVAEEVKRLASTSASMITEEGRQLSLRNMAEQNVRYEANMEDVENLKSEGVKLVFTSSHADCSKRCEKWQGKLFSLDGFRGNVDGYEVIPLDEALNDNGGNSIINGFNCRHYLIEYEKGMDAPQHYSKAQIKKERAIDQRQRQYENTIRHKKEQYNLDKVNPDVDKGQLEKEKKSIKRMELNYRKYSLQNNRASYMWRCQIDKDEEED